MICPIQHGCTSPSTPACSSPGRWRSGRSWRRCGRRRSLRWTWVPAEHAPDAGRRDRRARGHRGRDRRRHAVDVDHAVGPLRTRRDRLELHLRVRGARDQYRGRASWPGSPDERSCTAGAGCRSHRCEPRSVRSSLLVDRCDPLRPVNTPRDDRAYTLPATREGASGGARPPPRGGARAARARARDPRVPMRVVRADGGARGDRPAGRAGAHLARPRRRGHLDRGHHLVPGVGPAGGPVGRPLRLGRVPAGRTAARRAGLAQRTAVPRRRVSAVLRPDLGRRRRPRAGPGGGGCALRPARALAAAQRPAVRGALGRRDRRRDHDGRLLRVRRRHDRPVLRHARAGRARPPAGERGRDR